MYSYTAYAYAYSKDIDFFELSLEELMNIRVNIVSRRDQAIDDAPGIITVIQSSEFKRYGAKNLHDVMRLIPGFQQIYPQFTHRNSVAIRGQSAGALDKYFLILLNGKPLRDPILYGVNAPIYEGIPLELIDRLEIIKGPGSVVYGSNAFSGVMDIITKNQSDNLVSYKKGSFDTDISELLLTKTIQDLTFTGALRLHRSDGWKLEFVDTGNNNDFFYNENRSWGGFAEVKYKNFTFNYFKADVKEVATLSSGLISDATTRPTNRTFYAIGHEFEFNNNWQISTSISANYSTVAASTEYDARDVVLDGSAHGTFEETIYDVGFNLHSNNLINTNGTEVSDVLYKSIFGQVSTPLTTQVNLVAGLQIVDPQKSDIQYAPRLSIIGHFSESYNVKLIYGRAYSSPTGVEFSLDLPGLFSGNPNLAPTTIDNYDLQFSYKNNSLLGAIKLFYSEVEDSINLVSIDPAKALPKQFQNTAKKYFKGFELETKYHHNDQFEFIASFSYQTSKNEIGQHDKELLSNYLIRSGVAYYRESLSLSLFNIYHSKVGNRDPLSNPFNPVEKAYSFLTFNADYEVKHLFSANKGLTINFYIDNALNSQPIFLPDPTLSNLNTMPKIAERAYYLGVRFIF